MRMVCAALLAAVASFGGTASADVSKKFNGAWTVTMVTEQGVCDPSYRYGIAIRNGSIDDGSRGLSGRVDDLGKVQVVVVKGMARVGATGQLRGDSGGGTWRVPTHGCSGRWSAARS